MSAAPPLTRTEDFPILGREIDGRRLVYLDSAATSLTPRPVVDAIASYYENIGGNIHRGRHRLADEASEAARARVAAFVGAAPHEIAFVRNTTEGLNVVSRGLGLAPGDGVVLTRDAHHSQMLPRRAHADVASVDVTASGEPDLDSYVKALRGRPRLAALTHASNVTGVVAPLAELTALAHEAGALVVADLAQSVPHRRVRMRELGVVFAAFSAHKMLGPTGVGVLYVAEERLAELRSTDMGGGTVDWVDDRGWTPRAAPHRLEPGTPDIAGVLGTAAAADYLERIGMDAVERHSRELSAALRSAAAARPYLRPVDDGSAGERASILSVAVDGFPDLTELASALSDAHGVMCRSGFLCAQPFVAAHGGGEVLRISAYVYNDESDVETCLSALDELVAALAPARPRW